MESVAFTQENKDNLLNKKVEKLIGDILRQSKIYKYFYIETFFLGLAPLQPCDCFF